MQYALMIFSPPRPLSGGVENFHVCTLQAGISKVFLHNPICPPHLSRSFSFVFFFAAVSTLLHLKGSHQEAQRGTGVMEMNDGNYDDDDEEHVNVYGAVKNKK
jgi:hypothetical protein